MKLIIATIPDDKVDPIQESLQNSSAYVMYAGKIGDLRNSVLGSYRGLDYRQPRPRLRLEIVVVNDLVVNDVVETIVRIAGEADSDCCSNGNIFVMQMDAWVRIPAGHSAALGFREHSSREAS